ncbi:Nuclear transport factor 2 family protein with RNA binding domain [Hibiscus syriacus]|uniref:Nuclear transport factor 2 family protein with RNA binding domain n=1 Tax=Hibiscus syriacus TaxID=106335 RepID=A0A6A3ATZ2_HIBSY|nr:Nuclear transport factor 2 family protein with RNA binding domain [Hibiscus syriacus]
MQAINEKILALGYVDESGGQDSSPALENHIQQLEPLPEEANGKVYKPSEDNEEEETPVMEVVDYSQMVADSNSKMEQVPKKSYASILKENAIHVSIPTQSPVKSSAKSHEQPRSAATSSDSQIPSNNVVENGNNRDVKAEEGHSVYIKGLPLNATPNMVENEFKKFGMARSVQSALEASPINIGGRKAVEEKRSTSRGNRGRSSYGNGVAYRNERARGRGNYSGYGNSSNNRGAYFNRGGDGYPRVQHTGN